MPRHRFEDELENFIKEKEQLLRKRFTDETQWFKESLHTYYRPKAKDHVKGHGHKKTYKEDYKKKYKQEYKQKYKKKTAKINKMHKKKKEKRSLPWPLKILLSPFYLIYYILFTLYHVIAFVGMLTKYILLSPFLLIGFIVRKITEYIRMSLSFKITFVFSLVFIVFTVVYHLIIGLLVSQFTVTNYVGVADGLFVSAILSTLFGLFIMISIGVKVAQKVLYPIERMTEDIKDISSNSLDNRLNVSTAKDELKDLSIAFNGMLDELHEMYDKQSMFVSDASHELRTPIAVIQGYASMLDRWGKEDPEVLAESLQAIRVESENMKELIEKLLFLARADKNRIVLDKAFFDIHELMSEIIKETEMIAPQHSIINRLDFTGQLFGDQNSIKQALRVFMDNAIKYTPKQGEISILLYKKENNVIIGIVDTGIGIPKEDIPHIFDRFYRADKSRTKETGGNGLGLSIAKWILDQHHCTVDVQSAQDVGTRIEITFKYI